MAKRFGIDFFLTKTCNKACYYCTSFTKEQRNLEVDLDFLKFVLDEFKKYGTNNFVVRLLGGEPALINNLNEVINILRSYNLQKIAVYSNSLIRKKYPWILEDDSIDYFEHLFYKIENKKILKLGNYEFFEENNLNNNNIVVLTNNFITEYKNVNLTPLMNKNTIWKMVNDRSKVDTIDKYIQNYSDFKLYIETNNLKVASNSWEVNKLNNLNRKLCSNCPPSPVINFENKTIHHCSKVPNFSKTASCNEENINKLVTMKLFNDFPNYCRTCKEPSLDNRIKYKELSSKGTPIN